MSSFQKAIKVSRDQTCVFSCSRLYFYLKKFLSSKINPFITKKLLLLAIYDYLVEEIDFITFLFMANELYSGINNPFDLKNQDSELFFLLLDLDEIDEKTVTFQEEKHWHSKLEKYYRSYLPREFYIRTKVIERLNKVVLEKSANEIKGNFTKEAKNWQKNKISLAEIIFLARRINKFLKRKKEKERFSNLEFFLHRLDRVNNLISSWFLETEKTEDLIKYLIFLAAFPLQAEAVLKEVIEKFFTGELNMKTAVEVAYDIRCWAVFRSDKTVKKATAFLKNLPQKSKTKKAVERVFRECLKQLD